MKSLIKIILLVICIVPLLLASFTMSSSFLLYNNAKYVYAQELLTSPGNENLVCSDGLPPFSNNTCPDGNTPQMSAADQISQNESFQLQPPSQDSNISQPSEETQMDTNGDGVVDEFESQNQAVTQTPEEIQMDTNGDGVVDEFESQNQAVTQTPEEIQMDTNGDGVVDEFESQNQAGIAGQTAGSNLSQPSEEIQMDTNGDGVVDEFESQIADELVSIHNSFIVKLRSDDAGRINETIDLFRPDLEMAGGGVKSIYEDFGMFNLKFGGPQQAVDQVVEKLKANPAIEAVYNDTLITNDQSTSPGIAIPQLCDDNNPPNSNGICSDKSIPHYVTLRQQTECIVGSCVTKWIRAQQRTPTGIDRVDADLSPAKSGDGKGTVGIDIAILDTGVDRYHPDLNVWKCVSFVDGDDPNSCNDNDGHGTHVAGIAAALDNDVGVVGTAPGARIWAIKVQKDDASGTSSDLLEGLQYVAEHSPVTQAARSQLTDEGQLNVASMSIGSFSNYNLLKSKRDGKNIAPQLDEAIKNLVEKGVVVVVSAGNDNIDVKDQSPARLPEAIVVSAITDSNGKCGGKGVDIVQKGVVQLGVEKGYSPQTDRYGKPFDISNPDDFIASYSNYGRTVDLAAPGTHIYSTLPNGRYGYMSGTSMAAPHVAGAVALYLVLHNAAPAEVEDFLKKIAVRAPSGDPLVPCDGNGKGYFNNIYSGTWDTVVANDKNDEPLLYMGTNDWCQGVIAGLELCSSQTPMQRHILK